MTSFNFFSLASKITFLMTRQNIIGIIVLMMKMITYENIRAFDFTCKTNCLPLQYQRRYDKHNSINFDRAILKYVIAQKYVSF
jgi:hypothetical protein